MLVVWKMTVISVWKTMGYANDKQIPFVAIVGENEMAEGKLTLKNMTTGEQSLLTSDELLKTVRG